mmetsp:Transcript_6394/g.20115  ORF Transcript_6394/g.20115 Transcript_6394/m.20115 type:complete len:248 (+) Transcript_6394:348-1091(+)
MHTPDTATVPPGHSAPDGVKAGQPAACNARFRHRHVASNDAFETCARPPPRGLHRERVEPRRPWRQGQRNAATEREPVRVTCAKRLRQVHFPSRAGRCPRACPGRQRNGSGQREPPGRQRHDRHRAPALRLPPLLAVGARRRPARGRRLRPAPPRRERHRVARHRDARRAPVRRERSALLAARGPLPRVLARGPADHRRRPRHCLRSCGLDALLAVGVHSAVLHCQSRSAASCARDSDAVLRSRDPG